TLPAYAESRGEILRPIKISVSGYLLVVNPGIHISTKWAFGKITPGKPQISLRDLIINEEIKFDDLAKYAKNDFEPIVFREYPQIEEIKIRMENFDARLSLMTGTGSTVFGFFKDEEAAYQAEQFFKCKNYFTYLQKLN
ncbi:MAG: 4-(cytidine 5'-diphospho)-2-C-methyl-D-erythritol kinase, partial [Ignavibacterium sp.]